MLRYNHYARTYGPIKSRDLALRFTHVWIAPKVPQPYGTVRYGAFLILVRYCSVPYRYRTGTNIPVKLETLASSNPLKKKKKLVSEFLPDLCPDSANNLWTVHKHCLPKLRKRYVLVNFSWAVYKLFMNSVYQSWEKGAFWQIVHEKFVNC